MGEKKGKNKKYKDKRSAFLFAVSSLYELTSVVVMIVAVAVVCGFLHSRVRPACISLRR